ncbi:GATOR complex protein WDR59-like [Panonychus citri]|uniref:GATOR complex protein WDR59-like n=1 Tax=Panonychus citri TaxID=50023 RepID=UPI0023073691|nr:GATOR complex protein WDR59-like [Panonychus citri]
MSTRWSNEKVTAEHKDIEADVMCIHSMGRYIALSNPRNIYIIDIDNPSKIARSIARSSKWDVTASEWSPHQTSLLGLSYYQYVAVYSFADVNSDKGIVSDTRRFQRNPEPEILLKGHRRVVTDFNWAPFDPNILASCSMDTFVYVWDLREHRRPCLGFSSVVGPSQVKWSKSDENIIATALEGDIRIWDKRKVANPVHYISAHDQRIHGLDWNPYNGSQFATCSQDCTVKFWELSTVGQQDPVILSTKLPVWRAKFTPFRNGLITVVVPQLRRTGDINSLWLWNTNNLEQPVHSFFGPTDVVIDFGWRWRPDLGAADLVTWSKDSTLRIWSVDKPILSLFNEVNQDDSLEYSPAEEAENRNIFICNTINTVPQVQQERSDSIRLIDDNVVQYTTNADLIDRGNTPDRGKIPLSDINNLAKSSESKDVVINYKSKSFSPSSTKPQNYKTSTVEPISSGLLTPPDLQEEFALMNLDNYQFTSSNLRIEDFNPIKRYCIVSVETAFKSGLRVKLKVTFPNSYPNGIAPTFEILDEGELEKSKRNEILRILINTASKQVKQNRPCLEYCLRDFAASLDRKAHLNVSSLPNNPTNTSESDYSTLYGSFHDAQVPFPKICGGRFCGADLLVCFGKMSYFQRINDSNDHTPRALSDLSAYLQTNYRPLAPMPVKSFDFGSFKDNYSISSFPYYYGDDLKFRRFQSQGKERSYISLASMRCGPITIYNASELMPCSRSLAEKYIFNYQSRIEMCKKNAILALEESRKDLHQTWNLATLSCDPILAYTSHDHLNIDAPWATHPFGRKMIQSLIDYYLKTMGDVQMAAMLCCVFSSRCEVCGKMGCLQRNCSSDYDSSPSSYGPGESPYHTISGQSTSTTTPVVSKIADEWNIISAIKNFKRNRSNSWSDLGESEAPSSPYFILNSNRMNEINLLRDQREIEKTHMFNKMLDPQLNLYFDCIKQIYGDLLLRWGLLGKRAQLMKFVQENFNFQQDDSSLRSVNFASICQHCSVKCSTSSSSQCNQCKKLNLNCSLCNISVRGLVTFCHLCGHGGHTEHIFNWFTNNDNCPTGCGCKCVLE